MDTATLISIILAVISLFGTLVVAIANHWSNQKLQREAKDAEAELQRANNEANWKIEQETQRLSDKYDQLKEERTEQKETEALVNKYGQPLLVAAYELQARLFELCQYPISQAHLESKEGLQDLKKYTCYKFAQFLAWTHILKTKVQFFSFTDDENLRKIAYLILRVDEEFDRRRGYDGANVGVWPGSRVLVSERMLVNVEHDKEVPADTAVKGFHRFLEDWDKQFKEPMGYFCQWIDDLVIARKVRIEHRDDAFRCTQHNLVDLVQYLDKNKLYPFVRKVKKIPWFCDCTLCNLKGRDKPLEHRSSTRHNDRGLRPWYRYDNWDPDYDSKISFKTMQKMTCKTGFDQSLYAQNQGASDWRDGHWRDNDSGNWSDDGDYPDEDLDKRNERKAMRLMMMEMDDEDDEYGDEDDDDEEDEEEEDDENGEDEEDGENDNGEEDEEDESAFKEKNVEENTEDKPLENGTQEHNASDKELK